MVALQSWLLPRTGVSTATKATLSLLVCCPLLRDTGHASWCQTSASLHDLQLSCHQEQTPTEDSQYDIICGFPHTRSQLPGAGPEEIIPRRFPLADVGLLLIMHDYQFQLTRNGCPSKQRFHFHRLLMQSMSGPYGAFASLRILYKPGPHHLNILIFQEHITTRVNSENSEILLKSSKTSKIYMVLCFTVMPQTQNQFQPLFALFCWDKILLKSSLGRKGFVVILYQGKPRHEITRHLEAGTKAEAMD